MGVGGVVVVLGSLSGAWVHSAARLEAPGFIPAQWVAAAVPPGCAGGFKAHFAMPKQHAAHRENESREAKPYTHHQSLQETETQGRTERDCCRKRSTMSRRNKESQ